MHTYSIKVYYVGPQKKRPWAIRFTLYCYNFKKQKNKFSTTINIFCNYRGKNVICFEH